MPDKIEYLPAHLSYGTVTTKAGLREQLKTNPQLVKFVPLVTEPMTPAIHALNTTADLLPIDTPVSVTGPVSRRQWKAEVVRRADGKLVVR